MKITYLSHSAFHCITESGKCLIIDPFLDGNPASPVKSSEMKVDYIILTHGHGDHFGDTVKLAKRNDALVIAVYELATYCEELGLKSHGMHIGGSHEFPFGTVKFTMAQHGSMTPDGRYGGLAAGILLFIDGKVLYHTGDTGLFYDMKLIGDKNSIDVMLLPIGGNYTMDVTDAITAVEFVRPKLAVPMHFNTFPLISADPVHFIGGISAKGFSGRILRAGETLEI